MLRATPYEPSLAPVKSETLSVPVTKYNHFNHETSQIRTWNTHTHAVLPLPLSLDDNRLQNEPCLAMVALKIFCDLDSLKFSKGVPDH